MSTATLLGFCVLTALFVFRVFSSRGGKLPPSPRGVPILGNVFELGGSLPVWHAFDKLKKQFGPVVYLNLAGQDVVILNTKEAATELLERRSANYSDRPKTIVAEYLGARLTLPLARYGRTWKAMRRASHSVLNIRISTQYHSAQTDEALILAYDLLNQTAPILKSIQRCSASTVVSLVYGKPPVTSDNPVLKALNDIAHRFTQAVYPGAYLVELFPFLDYLPPALAKWKREAQADYLKITASFDGYLKDAIHDPAHKSSLCARLAEQQGTTGLTDEENAWLAGILYVAGFETTSSTLSWFLHAMSLYPDVQRRGQEEIDRVIGRSRTPTFADMDNLPYVRAMVKEVLRWQPAIPLGLPHVSMEDDWYSGYFIPKGTACIANIWSINRDEDTYGADAAEYRPDRFIDEAGTFRSDMDEGHSSYGFGRRICVGRHVADNALFIDICMILWALNVEPSKSDDQCVEDVKPSTQKDILNVLPDLQCKFSARFAEVETVLKRMRDEVLHSAAV